jgi:hypothetical protein
MKLLLVIISIITFVVWSMLPSEKQKLHTQKHAECMSNYGKSSGQWNVAIDLMCQDKVKQAGY